MKTIRLSNKLAFGKNNISKSVSSRNNNSRPVFRKNNDNSEVNRFSIDRNSIKHIKKLGKSKSEKMFKSQNLAELKKKVVKKSEFN